MPTSDTVGWSKIAQSYFQGKYPNYTGKMVGLKNWKTIAKIRHAVDIRIKKAVTEKCNLSLGRSHKKNKYKMK